MSTPRFAKVLEDVITLEPAERRELLEVLDLIPSNDDAISKEQLAKLILRNRGLILDAPPPQAAAVASRPVRKLIEIKGKPLSETIIEERR